MIYLLNAFSIQMLNGEATVHFQEVSELPQGLTSAIGHADTAAVLGVDVNRVDVKLNIGDVAYVAQLMGGRLPEGSTTLPEGFKFKFYKVTIDALHNHKASQKELLAIVEETLRYDVNVNEDVITLFKRIINKKLSEK